MSEPGDEISSPELLLLFVSEFCLCVVGFSGMGNGSVGNWEQRVGVVES